MVLKAGLACTLHDGEESESTAMCVERVAADLMGLTAAVAVALKRELRQRQPDESDEDSEELVRQWCEFYSEELLPDTKKFCKKVTPKLDTYGLYLPSRMNASLSPELLEKGLKLGKTEKEEEEKEEVEEELEEEPSEEEKSEKSDEVEADGGSADEGDVSMAMRSKAASPTQDEEDEYDEYEYDEYDEYD